MKNTRIMYQYVTRSGRKGIPSSITVEGTFTEEQKAAIADSLYDGTGFIPRLVGLPERRFSRWSNDDIVFFQLNTKNFGETSLPATVRLTADELTKAFVSHKGNWCKHLYQAVLNKQTEYEETPSEIILDEVRDECRGRQPDESATEVLNVIENALAKAGLEVCDRKEDTVVIRTGSEEEGDLNMFEVKICNII